MSSSEKDTPRNIARREMLKRVGVAGAVAAVPPTELTNSAQAQTKQAPAPLREALETLTATEARAAHYIDRALTGPLASSKAAFVSGLANNNGQVGRHYMTHNTSSRIYGLFPRNINNRYGTQGQGVSLDNWADDNFDHSALDYIGGGNLFVYSDRRPIDASDMPTFGKALSWRTAERLAQQWKSIAT